MRNVHAAHENPTIVCRGKLVASHSELLRLHASHRVDIISKRDYILKFSSKVVVVGEKKGRSAAVLEKADCLPT